MRTMNYVLRITFYVLLLTQCQRSLHSRNAILSQIGLFVVELQHQNDIRPVRKNIMRLV